ncbi:MAG: replicative DNA helicase [Alphaproteobacteria bacterium]|nr:replicative DNA helicase [Alphaproteobacteria bacterium]
MSKQVTNNLARIPEQEQVLPPTPRDGYNEIANIEAEQALLGVLLMNADLLDKVVDRVAAQDFYNPIHESIFAKIVDFSGRGMVPTPVVLKTALKTELESLPQGSAYLGILAAMASAVVHVKEYADIIHELALKRSLWDIGADMIYMIRHGDKTPQEQIEAAETALFELASAGSTDTGAVTFNQALGSTIDSIASAVKRKDSLQGVTTGFKDLDMLTAGLQKEDLYILAGRPSMGKTALALNIAYNAALDFYKQPEEDRDHVLFFSLEMGTNQLMTRILAMATGINSHFLKTGRLNDQQFTTFVRQSGELHGLPFLTDDTPALSIMALRSRIRRAMRKNKIGLVVIDYLQLVRGTTRQSEANRVHEVSEITRMLKAIAKEFKVPVLALSQLSRAVENRENKRPLLSDLRDSGSIEQDADVVMFIYREEYYLERDKPTDINKQSLWMQKMDHAKGKATVIMAKQRTGPIGDVDLYFDGNLTKFGDLAK